MTSKQARTHLPPATPVGLMASSPTANTVSTSATTSSTVRLVSHIPLEMPPAPVSLAAERSCSEASSSANSSLSSDDYHAFRPLTRHRDDETWEGSVVGMMGPPHRKCPPTQQASLSLSSTTSTAGASKAPPEKQQKQQHSSAPTLRNLDGSCGRFIVTESRSPRSAPTGSTKESQPCTTNKRPHAIPHLLGQCHPTSILQDGIEEDQPVTKKARYNKISPRNTKGIPALSACDGQTNLDVPKLVLLGKCHEDAAVLSSLHVFIRQQIEVFTATDAEMSQPAPGRRNPIQMHQVGLRCIHCRDLPLRDRVKRAVCYPSSVGRVYHAVSDMKCDHFVACKGMSTDLRAHMEQLKTMQGKKCRDSSTTKGGSGACNNNMTCSSSTAQYYHDAARQMGMVDGPGGVFLHIEDREAVQDQADHKIEHKPEGEAAAECHGLDSRQASQDTSLTMGDQQDTEDIAGESDSVGLGPAESQFAALDAAQRAFLASLPMSAGLLQTSLLLAPAMLQNALALSTMNPWLMSIIAQTAANLSPFAAPVAAATTPLPPSSVAITGKEQPSRASSPSPTLPSFEPRSTVLLLSTPTDALHLNPIHCFVRRHVELFAATQKDTTAPCPGRKARVLLGQVGLRCVHCAQLPMKQRVKRSVCYPPSLSGIYHAVSNMKFDHFALCKGLPPTARTEFIELRTSCGRGVKSKDDSKGLSNKNASQLVANSTAQYYHDSAMSMGLVDTEQGIRLKFMLDKQEHEDQDGNLSGARKVANARPRQVSTTTESQAKNTASGGEDDQSSISSSGSEKADEDVIEVVHASSSIQENDCPMPATEPTMIRHGFYYAPTDMPPHAIAGWLDNNNSSSTASTASSSHSSTSHRIAFDGISALMMAASDPQACEAYENQQKRLSIS